MKKTISFIAILLCLSFLSAVSLTVSADLASLQDFIIKRSSYQFGADIRVSVSNRFELKLPATLVVAPGTKLIDTGLSVNYYPWTSQGFFMNVSLAQFGLIMGDTDLEKNFYGLNEAGLGWQFRFFDGLIVEPGIFIKDPSGTFDDEYEQLKGIFPCYTKFRIKLSAGWSFDLGKKGVGK